MTVAAWFGFSIIAIIILIIAITFFIEFDNLMSRIIDIIISAILIVGMFFGMKWYFSNTASGQRALVSQKSNLSNGIERTITIYTANGNVIAKYSGKIDIADNDGDYLLFDYDGKRYIYYNCFVESIADIN